MENTELKGQRIALDSFPVSSSGDCFGVLRVERLLRGDLGNQAEQRQFRKERGRATDRHSASGTS